jgi:hypothetical protein
MTSTDLHDRTLFAVLFGDIGLLRREGKKDKKRTEDHGNLSLRLWTLWSQQEQPQLQVQTGWKTV